MRDEPWFRETDRTIILTPEPPGPRAETLARFVWRFQRSPIRWVVAVHAVLLVGVIWLNHVFLGSLVTSLLEASLAFAQVALLLIWITLDTPTSLPRYCGASLIALGMMQAHMLPHISLDSGLLCFLPAVFAAISVLSLPLLITSQTGLAIRRFHLQTLPPPQRLQFSIRSVLLASITVSLLFGLASLPGEFQPIDNELEINLASVMMGIVVFNVYLTIPVLAVLVMLRPGRILPRLAMALVTWGLIGALVFHFVHQARMEPEALVFPSVVTAGGLAILLATLLALRTMGYRAVWRSELAAAHSGVACPFSSY